jgi:transcriptional regulator with XRE-family HTH domain
MQETLVPAPLQSKRVSFGDMLKHWRAARRMSQLALAEEARISARHLCFLETGRSKPSREMVQALAAALDIPLGSQNELLLAAGFAPAFGAHDLDAPELSEAQRALEFILEQQEPYPAIVIDEEWNVRRRNAASAKLFGRFQRHYDMDGALKNNVMHALCHPKGLRPFMLNWQEFTGPFVHLLYREGMHTLNPAAARLRDALLAYPGVRDCLSAIDSRGAEEPLQTMRLRDGNEILSFFTTLTAFAMPRDVALQRIKIECFFPADDATATALKRAASG